MTLRRRQSSSGMTLIEVMVALSILALMLVIGWGTTRQTIRARKYYGEIGTRYREVRNAVQIMTRDLGMAYVSNNEDRSLQEPRTRFVSDSFGDIDAVTFSTMSNTPLFADANESDQTVVSYYGAPDKEDRSRVNLVRRVLRRPWGEKPSTLPGQAEIVLGGITKLELSYYDTRKADWQESWTTQGLPEGTPPVPPDRVRIKLTFLDERGKEVTIVTEVRCHLQEMLQFYAT